MMNVVITIIVGTIGWIIAKKLKLPAPGMLGSMLLVGITNIIFDYADFTIPIKVFGVAISGAYIGVQIQKKDIKNFKFLVKPFFILITMLTINTFFTATIIHYLSNMDWLTALLSCVAGGVTDMSIVAMDMNAEVGTVAMMQTVRLIGVLLIFPYWIIMLTKNEPAVQEDERFIQQATNKRYFLDKYIDTVPKKILFTLVVAYIFGYIGQISGIPAASMMIPMFVVMFLNVNTNYCIVNKKEKLIAQIMAGSVVGSTLKASTFSSLNKTLIPVIILLLSYFLVNFIFSYLCKKKNYLDLKSAMFASAPGGATDMTLIAADLGADLTKIALIQALRAAYAVSLMPMLIMIFMRIIS